MDKFFLVWDDVKSFIAYIFIGLIGIIAYFFKSIFSEHRDMKRFHQGAQERCKAHSENLVKQENAIKELNELKIKVLQIENNSKQHYIELSADINTNNQVLLEKMNNVLYKITSFDKKFDNFKQETDKKIEKIESRLSRKENKRQSA